MKVMIKSILINLLLVVSAIYARESSCISCHKSSSFVSDTTIVIDFMSDDIHQRMGLGCQDCHGGNPLRGFNEGDPSLAMDPAKGYQAPPDRFGIPQFCARCHSNIEYMKQYNPKLPTDQLELYKTSNHGKALLGKKDSKVAICTDCHGIHNILPSSDSRSKTYHNNIPGTCGICHADKDHMKGHVYKGKPIPTNQLDEYKKSVHGILVLEKGDKSAPACNNCHGNHGATPPALASVSAACGECHANNRDFFNNSPHKEPWKELGYPECEMCHGNHNIQVATDTLLGVGQGALCVECHDAGTEAYLAASTIKASIDSLRESIILAEAAIGQAEQKGVEGGQARFDLGPAKDNLTRVRSVIHTVDPDQVKELTSIGIKTAANVRQTARAALGDIKSRQIGLAMSLILVAFLAFALWRKIKAVDKKLLPKSKD